MKILAFDTSSSACSLALLIDDKIIARHELAPMQQAKLILPMLDELLRAEKVALNQLDAIAFGCGPGSFTGVRIAISTAQGLAYAAQLPLISVSSLAAVAQSTYQELGWKKIVAAVDARINEVYWGAYQVQDGLVSLIGKETVSLPEAITLPAADWCGAGNAWEVYRDKIQCQPAAFNTACLPAAAAILPLAKAKFLRRDWVTAAEAVPVYLRDEVAQKAKQS